MSIKVTVKVPGIDRMRKALVNNPRLSTSIAKAWSTLYRAFIRQRFHKFSRGGGDWAPLKASTLKRRRKGKGTGEAAILRDTGALFAALQPTTGFEGLIQSTPRPLGFTAFLGGGKSYKTGATLVQIAEYHHFGEGRLPARAILVQPDITVIDRMGKVGVKILTDELNGGQS